MEHMAPNRAETQRSNIPRLAACRSTDTGPRHPSWSYMSAQIFINVLCEFSKAGLNSHSGNRLLGVLVANDADDRSRWFRDVPEAGAVKRHESLLVADIR